MFQLFPALQTRFSTATALLTTYPSKCTTTFPAVNPTSTLPLLSTLLFPSQIANEQSLSR